MKDRSLTSWQVAGLLVSASYGIGFLFGSGEMALTHGMGGSVYGLATALGMLLLAVAAARFWRVGVPVWDYFGQAYGARLRNAVALLSLVWMAGVLAAQVHGGVAIAKLLGFSPGGAFAVVLAGIYMASRLDLRAAARVFAICLAASGGVLVFAVITGHGVDLYLHSPARLAADLPTFEPGRLLALVLAVVALVLTGADYHQFVLAAKRPAEAVWGCVLAGLCLALVSPLPASIALALQRDGYLESLADPKQVIPFALARAAASLAPGASAVLLLGLSTAALGSGAAIVRAMSSALSTITHQANNSPAWWRTDDRVLTLMALAMAGALAARGQGIVETMVSVNVIYIASVAITFAALLAGRALAPERAMASMAAGFGVSCAASMAAGLGLVSGGDLLSLGLGLGAAALGGGIRPDRVWRRRDLHP